MYKQTPARTHLRWLIAPLLAVLLAAACGTSRPGSTPPTPAVIIPATATSNATVPPATPATVIATPVPRSVTPTATATTIPATATPEPTATPEATVPPAAIIAEPARLRIPSIGVDANVQQVGLDEQGLMGVPSNYTDAAWYQAGARPGNPGNAVIDGHLDSKTGPAVFYQLGNLKPGDEVFIVTADGAELRFLVTGLEIYATADAPTFTIFGPATEPQLNLITCDGTFNRDIRQYDQRLLVRTVLAPP